MNLSPRLQFFTAAFGILGLFLTLRFLLHWLRALSRRFRRGVPYMYGSAGRAFLLLVFSSGLLLAGILLGGAGWGLTSYQPFSEVVLVGTVQVRSGGERNLSFFLRPADDYPLVRGNPEMVIPAGRWSIVGRFILWAPALKWLGLRDSHRLSSVLSVPGQAAIPRPEAISRGSLTHEGGEWFWRFLHDYDRYNPLVETREFQTPWKSGPAEDLELYASPVGYLFAVKEAKHETFP